MNSAILPSFAWALLHSIWQLGLIAILLFGVLRYVPGRFANRRYWLSFGALVLGFITLGSTFIGYLARSTSSNAFFATDEPVAAAFMDDIPAELILSMQTTWMEQLEFWVQQNSSWIALAWSAGILALSIYYALGLGWSQVIRRYRTTPLSDPYFTQWQAIYSLTGMTKYIEIKQSFLVKGPLTVGHVKPIILVPIGFFTSLSPSQVEAILLHELAHIKRHDYLFNLLQVCIKLVLFYHPATWFICRCIDTEREHACDDLAMSNFADPKAYVRALGLLRIQFFNQKNQWAMQFYKHEPAFLARLKRLANPMQDTISKRKNGAMIVPICLILLGGVFVSFKEQVPEAAILTKGSDFLMDMNVEGPTSTYAILQDTIIPEEESEEITETPASTEFPIVEEEEIPIVVEEATPEMESQINDLLKLQFHIAQQKRELEAAQHNIYLEYAQGFLSKEEKEKAISELQRAYEQVDKERATIFELQRHLNSKLPEEQRERLKGLYLDGGEVYRFDGEGGLRLEGTARFPSDLNSVQDELYKGKLRIIEGSAFRDDALRQLREDQRRITEEQRRLAEIQYQKAQAERRLAEIQVQEEALKQRMIAEENIARIRSNQDARMDKMRAQAEALRENQLAYAESFPRIGKNRESFPVRLKQRLVADGLVKDNGKKIKIRIKDGEISINKQQLKGALKEKYYRFFKAEALDMKAQHDIEIRTNGFKKTSSLTEE
ncbi:MAG: M56 family metallopeptidase [Bacteroidota bacterium]